MAPLVPALAALLLVSSASAQLNNPKEKPRFEKDKKSAGSGVQGKPLDLSGLLGGPRIAGPDPNGPANSGPDKYTKMVLAAVDQIEGNPYALRVRFGKAFGKSISADEVKEAGQAIRAQIKAGKIKVANGENMAGVAAYWQPEPDASGDWLVGTMGLKKSLLDGKASEYRQLQGPPNFAFNCSVDQIANSIIHEVAHVYFTFFAKRKGLQAQPSSVEETFSANYHWNGGVQPAAAGQQSAGSCKRDPNKPGYTYKLSNQGYGQSSDEDSARYVAAQLQDSTQGDALKAVLRDLW